MSYQYVPHRWTGATRRAFFGWDGSYNYGHPISGIKQAGEPIAAEPEPIPEIRQDPSYSQADKSQAMKHLKEFNLYSGGRKNLELIQATARIISQGGDPQAIDLKSLTTKDKSLEESIEDDRTACMYQDGVW